jgi:hypothetical protein
VAETTAKDLIGTLVKSWDRCINIGGGYVEK